MDELVIGEKRYVSSKRAAEITGYAKDYVGQLCREGYVEAKMVGRGWYVLEESIREHRFGSGKRGEEEATQKIENTEKEILSAFGDIAAEKSAENLAKSEGEPEEKIALDWEPPVYSSEPAPQIPEIASRPRNIDREGAISDMPASRDTETSIADMQAAWKEWFEQKRNEAPERASDENYSNYDDIAIDRIDEGTGQEIYGSRTGETAPEHDFDSRDAYTDTEEEHEPEPTNIRVTKIRPPAPLITDMHVHPVPENNVTIQAAFEPMSSTSPQKKRRARKEKSSLPLTALLLGVAVVAVSIAAVGSGYVKTNVHNPVIDFLGGTSTITK